MAGFQYGDRVIVTVGPLADFSGTVDDIDRTRGTLRVLVDVDGRTTPVEVEPHHIRLIDQS